jgi:tetratricopeptide (TPR) repeat protein
VLSWSESRVITVVEAERCAREALRIDGDNPDALGALAGSLMLTFQLDQADALATDVIRLNPGSPTGYWVKAWVMTWAGSYEGALVSIRRAFEIGPREPLRWNYYSCISLCEFMLGRFEAGLTAAERALQLNPKATGALMLRPACLVELGRLEEAHEALASTLRSQPWRGTAAGLRVVVPLKKRDDLERLVVALVKAGLPEA